MNCDLCGSSERTVIYSKLFDTALAGPGFFDITACSTCSLVYLFPRPLKEEMHVYYPSGYAPYKKSGPFLSFVKKLLWKKDKALIGKIVAESGSILEVGAANGEYLTLVGQGRKLFGLEMDKGSVEDAKKYFNLDFWEGRLEDFVFPADLKFNLCILRYVLEHVESPRTALLKLRKNLASEGCLLISIPNFDSIERRVFGRYWHNFDVPRHFFIFSEGTINRYAAETGFEVISVTHSFLPNEWIEGIGRLLREKGFFLSSKFFTYKNPFLIIFFLPLSLFGFFVRKSSRVTCLLKAK